jgi:hypothetical protein
MQTISPKNLLLATYLTGIYDVNRNQTLPNDDVSAIEKWADSILTLDLHGVVFHNSLTDASTQKYAPNIRFIQVTHDDRYNTNVYRYFLYKAFIQKNIAQIQSIFITDITDVVVNINPFVQPLFVQNPTFIFSGDEPKPLQNDWMYEHSAHLRSQIAGYAAYEALFKADVLLNCGVVGGNINIMYPFIQKLCAIHQNYNRHNTTNYTGDMGAYNYLLRTHYTHKIIHGMPVNTVFKADEIHRKDCWFRHK